jgi:DNA-binding CsgD family transcriptional regulator
MRFNQEKMRIQELAPMNVQQYASHYLSVPMPIQAYPNPFDLFAPTIEALKKMAFAPYYWFVIDYTKSSIVAVSPGVEQHLAFTRQELLADGLACKMKLYHPDDIEIKFAYDYFQEKYLGTVAPERRKHLRFNTFYRMKHPSGIYHWNMAQMPDYYYDDNGNIVYSLRVVYDITHIKQDGVAMMTLLDDSDPYNQIFLCQSNQKHKQLIDKLLKLTDRELQVIRLLVAGQLGKQIASQLGLSPQTVENHKQNIFRKTETRSSIELVAFAIRSGIA